MVVLLDLDDDDGAFDPFARPTSLPGLQTPSRYDDPYDTVMPDAKKDSEDARHDPAPAAAAADRANPNLNHHRNPPDLLPRPQHPARPLSHLPPIPAQPGAAPLAANPANAPLRQRPAQPHPQHHRTSRHQAHERLRAGPRLRLPALRLDRVPELHREAAPAVAAAPAAPAAVRGMPGGVPPGADAAVAGPVRVRRGRRVPVRGVRHGPGGRGHELPAHLDVAHALQHLPWRAGHGDRGRERGGEVLARGQVRGGAGGRG
ncbi:MAG: hypothetical protein Q9173_007147 [Seirophora scorigena]